MTMKQDQHDGGRRDYPDALKLAEQHRLKQRRAMVTSAAENAAAAASTDAEAAAARAQAIPEQAPVVGLALSGGGIRSATFSLGVIQALVKGGLLSRIDYLSTVSGGGYIGGFLGRLYSRHYATPATVNYLLHPERAAQPKPPWPAEADPEDPLKSANLNRVDPFGWLRDNGRYLAPNGTGDVVLAFAVAIRNWVALQLVFCSFLLVPLLIAQLLRRWIETSAFGQSLAVLPTSASQLLDGASGGLLTWSPFVDLMPLMVMLWVFPFGWAYWIIEQRRRWEAHPAYGVALLVVVSLFALGAGRPSTQFTWWQPLFIVLIGSSALASVIAIWATQIAKDNVIGVKDLDGDRLSHARNIVTRGLSLAVASTLALGAFVVIDTLGQSLYEQLAAGGGGAMPWFAALIAAGAPVAVRLMRLPALLSSLGSSKAEPGFKLPVEWIAAAVSVVIAVIVLSGLDAFAHGMANGFAAVDDRPRHLWLPLIALGLLLAFAVLFGWTWPFLNRSSQSSLYKSRLSRAYLGASNWRRFLKTRDASVTDPIAGDDVSVEDYWKDVVDHGGPLHLINVTINETAGDDAKTVLRDRKGISLAAGPCGYSAGARHHALRNSEADAIAEAAGSPIFGPQRTPKSERREPVLALRETPGYSMFHRREVVAAEDAVNIKDSRDQAKCVAALEQVEKLSLAQWIAISGAAFTTGLGSRTTIGLSFLLGFANVRLGYWWDAGDCMDSPRGLGATVGQALRSLFPIQFYLIDEFTATFRGPSRRRWYLSDGGHFENMGAYELIRRRVPMIIIVDGETDNDYTYEGVANLVRKARLDFNAEISFLKRDELDTVLHPALRSVFGDLDDLRPVPITAFSRHHAALARVRYIGSEEQSLIIYLKATLSEHDPADVREYRAKNPDFPQQTTIDQFFDESQWESYRKLGEVIGGRVFAKPARDDGWFSPSTLWPQFDPKTGAITAGSTDTSSSRGSRA